uniref:PPIase cyclophilin-type domain-containing protein n=1 Tax=Globisporangium ultimum (strain ATCC 200006 / CBS 805.95 / DAOM BR144) TaxID=431595 RepID=K3WTN7_GLOUD
MSNIYITEPNTEGKVLLHTSFGDLDVELWPQQAPKACRNFVQLCLEGYYDDTIFHRIIAGFMVQGGDPTGTGNGGESIYGGAFIDEFHSRLKFNHRGLVAMANENKPNTNHSQFFFTLDACEFLEKKHTIFGKITGNTIFNLLSVGDVETDAKDRPLHPPKLLSVEVLWNPFEDIVPRAIKHAKLSDATEDAAKKKKRERKATKDLKLLSFGDEEEEFQQEVSKKKAKTKKGMSSHDLLDDKKLKAEVDEVLLQKIAVHGDASKVEGADRNCDAGVDKKEAARNSLKAAVASAAARKAEGSTTVEKPTSAPNAPDSSVKPEKESSKRPSSASKLNAASDDKDEYTRLREELRSSKKAATVLMGSKAKEQEDAKAFHDMLTPLQQQRQKYLQKKKASSRSGREQDTLQKLMQFKAKLEGVNQSADKEEDSSEKPSYHGQVLDEDSDDGKDADERNDLSWMTAKLKFKKHIDVRLFDDRLAR